MRQRAAEPRLTTAARISMHSLGSSVVQRRGCCHRLPHLPPCCGHTCHASQPAAVSKQGNGRANTAWPWNWDAAGGAAMLSSLSALAILTTSEPCWAALPSSAEGQARASMGLPLSAAHAYASQSHANMAAAAAAASPAATIDSNTAPKQLASRAVDAGAVPQAAGVDDDGTIGYNAFSNKVRCYPVAGSLETGLERLQQGV